MKILASVCQCWLFSVDAREAGEGKLNVVILNPDGLPLPSIIETDNQGAHAVMYTPCMAGIHHADIYFNGQSVAGSLSSLL